MQQLCQRSEYGWKVSISLDPEEAALGLHQPMEPFGNLNRDGEFPSMFDPVHGSAPDIGGKGIADVGKPTAEASQRIN